MTTPTLIDDYIPFDQEDAAWDAQDQEWENTALPFHDVANIFPMMSAEEYDALIDDIAKNGQIEPIWTYQGAIIDGRNRYKACRELKVQPLTREWSGVGSLIQFVISLNLKRRHLSSSQRAVLALEVERYLSVEAKERQRAAGGDRKSSEYKTQGSVVQNFAQPILADMYDFDDDNDKEVSEPFVSHQKSRDAAAAIVGTNRQYVSDVKKIQAAAPDLLEKVRSGESSIQDAKREMKERTREAVREDNRRLVEAMPPIAHEINSGTYQAIAIDPPWDWGDEGDQDQLGRARPTYATMPFEDILNLPVGDLAAPNAHIYLWITNRSLPKGFALLEKWGFRYVTCVTWCKPSIGMGNYFRGSTEQILFGVRGSLPLLRRDMGTWFNAARPSRHSAKPDAFYEMVESCSPGPWLEMFSRTERNGWALWGAEVCSTNLD